MKYTVCFMLALFLFAAGIILACKQRKSVAAASVKPLNCLLIAVFSSSVCLLLPIYANLFRGDSFSYIKTFLLSVHNSIRLFLVDGEFDIIDNNITSDIGSVWAPYSVFAAILFVMAPILTFSVILSFIRNAYAYIAYTFAFFKDIYVFSELNSASAALAESIKRKNTSAKMVFTDVFESNEEEFYELMQKARLLSGIVFKYDIAYINYRFHSKRKKLVFITIGKDEQENVRQSINLITNYKNRENTSIYVFSSRSEGELLLSDIDKGRIKVRRINESDALISRYLYEYGESLFDDAVEADDAVKEIKAVIIGIGQYGEKMLKALPWFCQMEGCRVYIEAYDKKEKAGDRIRASCPELLSPEHNGVFDPDDAEYEITIREGINVDSASFTELFIQEEKKTTFVFVATGDDNENVRIATNLRTMYERAGIHPRIVTVVNDSDINYSLQNIRNFRGQPYDIQFIGAADHVYSEQAIFSSELEQEALKRHLKWGSEEDFWKYEYNYKSSVATTIHSKMKEHCKIKGAEKEEDELSEEERNSLERLEHRRWNAYMRAEGYVYSNDPDPSTKNHLAKMHNNLVPYQNLTEEDKRKDSKAATKV